MLAPKSKATLSFCDPATAKKANSAVDDSIGDSGLNKVFDM